MSFNSAIFLFFFLPVVVAGSVLLRKHNRIKTVWLVLASLGFYGWCNLRILAFLLVYGLIHYWLGCLLEACGNRKTAGKCLLIFGVLLDLACLFSVKYLNYAISLGNRFFSLHLSPVENLLVPLGISFLCFSMIAYLVDIYRGKTPALRNIFDFYLYLSFFPKVSQGPITRLDEMNALPALDLDAFTDGLRRFVSGLGKKVLIADVLGGSVDMALANLSGGISTATAWMSVACYTLQIYYDFSGYTDMALGIAKMLGFTLPENFDLPYLSKSVSEFWRRWHMSLGRWFKEYLYFPLGGSRKGTARTILNLSVVWLFTGIWHGAATTYIVWGLYFGAFVILEKLIGKTKLYAKLPNFLKWAGTLLIVMVGWVFFRSDSLQSAGNLLQTMCKHTEGNAFGFRYYFDSLTYLAMAVGIMLTLPHKKKELNTQSIAWRLAKDFALVLVLLASILFMINSTYTSFIYFQF